jgi:hypothetical protein
MRPQNILKKKEMAGISEKKVAVWLPLKPKFEKCSESREL